LSTDLLFQTQVRSRQAIFVPLLSSQRQDSRDISAYAYQRGAASLLDFLDAERSYRATQLTYRQALAPYMISVEQLRQAEDSRTLP